MCLPQRLHPELGRHEQTDKVRAARKILRKYRKREERRELMKLRKLIPRKGKLRNQDVIDETISLIVSLEQQLLEKIWREGRVPPCLQSTGLRHHQVSPSSLREAMALLMPRSPSHGLL